MALDPEASDLFDPWTDPESGIVSYVLRDDTAPVYQSFYFTNSNVGADGRYLWMYVSYPPTDTQTLAVYDANTDSVRSFPSTGFNAVSPHVDPDTGAITWACKREDAARVRAHDLYRRGPDPGDRVEHVGHIPRSVVGGAEIRNVTSHFQPSADGRRYNIELSTPVHSDGDRWHVGTYDIETDEVTIWDSFTDRRFNHSQFNPVDPDLMLLAQDWWIDFATGEHHDFDNRLWLARPDTGVWPVFDEMEGKHAHEWWAPDGTGIWYVDYESGTRYYDLNSETDTLVWPGGTCHAHASTDGQLLVGDVNTYSWEEDRCHVAFYDRETGVQVDIVSDLPEPIVAGDNYHVDPHPQLVQEDTFVSYTTTVDGAVSLALVPVERLLERTR
jgi:hypothetical protein